MLRQKKKKYTEEEVKNKSERIDRLSQNIELLQEMHIDQNAFEQGKLGIVIRTNDDIEKQMVFYSQKEIRERAKKYKDADDDEDAMREMNDYEQELMKKFEENDHEIDEMLGQVIEMVGKLKLHAEGISTQINTQKDLIKNLNSKAEKARRNLEKRQNALEETLNKYRSTNKMCIDMILVVVFLILIGVMIQVLRRKGYF